MILKMLAFYQFFTSLNPNLIFLEINDNKIMLIPSDKTEYSYTLSKITDTKWKVLRERNELLCPDSIKTLTYYEYINNTWTIAKKF